MRKEFAHHLRAGFLLIHISSFVSFALTGQKTFMGFPADATWAPTLAFTEHPKRRTSNFCSLNSSFDPQDCRCFFVANLRIGT